MRKSVPRAVISMYIVLAVIVLGYSVLPSNLITVKGDSEVEMACDATEVAQGVATAVNADRTDMLVTAITVEEAKRRLESKPVAVNIEEKAVTPKPTKTSKTVSDGVGEVDVEPLVVKVTLTPKPTEKVAPTPEVTKSEQEGEEGLDPEELEEVVLMVKEGRSSVEEEGLREEESLTLMSFKSSDSGVSSIAQPRALAAKVDLMKQAYGPTITRLNVEAYKLTQEVVNPEHLERSFGKPTTKLGMSYAKYNNPLMLLALSVNEMGCYRDPDYTWSAPVYSSEIVDAGISMDNLYLYEIDKDWYNAKGIYGVDEAYGFNDLDSLGALQILRRYVKKPITYSDGDVCADLLSWTDSCQWCFHTFGTAFYNENSWMADTMLENEYQLFALEALGHNSGVSPIESSKKSGQFSSSSAWASFGAAVGYALDASDETTLTLMQEYVDGWYECYKKGDVPTLAGEWEYLHNVQDISTGKLAELLDIDEYAYVKSGASSGNKQHYIMNAMLNYMSLERLYKLK